MMKKLSLTIYAQGKAFKMIDLGKLKHSQQHLHSITISMDKLKVGK